MTEEETRHVESCSRQHQAALEHQSRMSYLVEQEELGKFALLKPKLVRDGNQWCVLYGADIRSGIVGFGDTPILAIRDWNKAWEVLE